jgi:hypothetical protein
VKLETIRERPFQGEKKECRKPTKLDTGVQGLASSTHLLQIRKERMAGWGKESHYFYLMDDNALCTYASLTHFALQRNSALLILTER